MADQEHVAARPRRRVARTRMQACRSSSRSDRQTALEIELSV